MGTIKQSVFMQMHNGTRTCEGSFNCGLRDLFYIADQGNRHKLVAAFPEFFGAEVPEFNIRSKRPVKYKGWQIKWEETEQLFALFTPDELEQPVGSRQEEALLATIEQAKAFIDNY
jgi:hypothetical protein